MDGFATHLPVLMAAVARFPKPRILELGMGDYSTPVLHAVVAGNGGYMLSLEYLKDWGAKFVGLAAADMHDIQMVDSWPKVKLEELPNWDVCFVDNGPFDTRDALIARLADRSKLLVIHDTEACCYKYEPVLKRFPYRVDFKRYVPWTSIVSMTDDLSWAPQKLTWLMKEG